MQLSMTDDLKSEKDATRYEGNGEQREELWDYLINDLFLV
jgi:hypothetical protein